MQLLNDITFDDGRIEKTTLNPAKNGAQAVVTLSVRMSQEAAAALGKSDELFNKKGIAHSFKSHAYDEVMVNTQLRIPPTRGLILSPSKMTAFSVEPESGKEETDGTLRMHFSAHFKGDEVCREIADWVIKQNKDYFRVKFDPKQGALFEKGAAKNVNADDSDAEKEQAGTLATKAQMGLGDAE